MTNDRMILEYNEIIAANKRMICIIRYYMKEGWTCEKIIEKFEADNERYRNSIRELGDNIVD